MAAELPARQNEAIYVRSVASHFGGLPTADQVGQAHSANDLTLYSTIVSDARATDLSTLVEADCASKLSQ